VVGTTLHADLRPSSGWEPRGSALPQARNNPKRVPDASKASRESDHPPGKQWIEANQRAASWVLLTARPRRPGAHSDRAFLKPWVNIVRA